MGIRATIEALNNNVAYDLNEDDLELYLENLSEENKKKFMDEYMKTLNNKDRNVFSEVDADKLIKVTLKHCDHIIKKTIS